MSTLKNNYRSRSAVEQALKAGTLDFSHQDLSSLDLSGVVFPENCNFTGSDFRWADLRRAHMQACVFRQAVFSEVRASYADFSESNFFEAQAERADFAHANLSNCDLKSMSVHRAHLDEKILPWLTAIIEHGVRVPAYRVDSPTSD